MPRSGRIGNLIMGLCGMLLAGWMGYTLVFEPAHSSLDSGEPRPVDAEVSVFFPDRGDWRLFREAASACVQGRQARKLEEEAESFTLLTSKHGRRIRFQYHGVRGIGETREDIRKRLSEPPPPVAVVGSVNTLLTETLAQELEAYRRQVGDDSPPLLIPWATAVDSDLHESPPFLDLYRDHMFRFCANDQHQADLVVDAVSKIDRNSVPGLVHLVIDSRDPYSVDLAECFRRTLGSLKLNQVSITVHNVPHQPRLSSRSKSDVAHSDSARKLAREILQSIENVDAGKTVWVLLPLLSEPTSDMLGALRTAAASMNLPVDRLRVLCGDGADEETLVRDAGQTRFPIYCISTAFAPGPNAMVDADNQVLAEILASLLVATDRPQGERIVPIKVVDSLSRLKIEPNDPRGFGRPVAFDSQGERISIGSDQIDVLEPGQAGLRTYRRIQGQWNESPPNPGVRR